ncbi:MAG TPA: hypothetical protein PLZ16_14600, partial [Gammaproteobacteria bacterium]|nr:hypothetical protein [Gammaproteobacteria bacterium]
LLLVVSVPSQQLNKVASQSLWNDIGVTKIRTLVRNWSGGRLPLKDVDRYKLQQPVAPAAIERPGVRPDQSLQRIETAVESNGTKLPVPQLEKEILGETAPVLSESGATLFGR